MYSDVSNPLRLEGDPAIRAERRRTLRVSNPLRLEGDRSGTVFNAAPRHVSNPLRLEGDGALTVNQGNIFLFLIHYGWRGTWGGIQSALGKVEFLIHYGWRGTTPDPMATALFSRGF